MIKYKKMGVIKKVMVTYRIPINLFSYDHLPIFFAINIGIFCRGGIVVNEIAPIRLNKIWTNEIASAVGFPMARAASRPVKVVPTFAPIKKGNVCFILILLETTKGTSKDVVTELD